VTEFVDTVNGFAWAAEAAAMNERSRNSFFIARSYWGRRVLTEARIR
jgi:hypothetical protein